MNQTIQQYEHLEHLIKRAEQEAISRPRAYQLKVAMLGALGYLVIFAMLFSLLALTVGLGWAALASPALLMILVKQKLIIAVLAMIFVLMRGLLVKIDAPAGYRLSAKEYPQLFESLQSLTKKSQAPRLHQVILVPEHNAGIVQTPRFGVFGFHKNTLILGLELLLCLTPAQAEAVIAHELGHLSVAHGRFGAWVYRVRLSWQRIMASLEQTPAFGVSLLRRFFNWYSPTFSAYTFALARANEFTADAFALQQTSRVDTAKALTSTRVVGGLLQDHFWRPFFQQADVKPEPNAPFRSLRSFLQSSPFDNRQLDSKLYEAMTETAGYFDTHPSLSQRLAALKIRPQLPELPVISAAEAWLGAALDNVLLDFDCSWVRQNDEQWRMRYQYCEAGRNELSQLQRLPLDSLSLEQYWHLAKLTEEFAPDTDPLPLFQSYRCKFADARADFVIGGILLQRDDASGIELLQKAMGVMPELAQEGCGQLANYYHKHGDKDAVQHWLTQFEQQMEINRQANLERVNINSNDRLVEPKIDAESLEYLRKAFSDVKGIGSVWLAEKVVKHYPNNQAYVLLVIKKRFVNERKLLKSILDRLKRQQSSQSPGNLIVLMNGRRHAVIAKRAIQVGIALHPRK